MAKKPLDSSEMTDSNDEFEAIYESNAPLIYRFMFWRTKDVMLAEDLTSHVFEKAWRSRSSFKGGSAKAWLHKIARNTLIDHWRKPREVFIENPDLVQSAEEATTLDKALDQEMLIDKLQGALSQLPKDMRSVVELRFVDGLSARHTGQKLGISEANVRVIQYRALIKLRGYLK